MDTFSLKELEKMLKECQKQKHCGVVEMKVNFFKGGVTSVQLKRGFSYKTMTLEHE